MTNWNRADKIGLVAFGVILLSVVVLAFICVPNGGAPKDAGQQVTQADQAGEEDRESPPGPVSGQISLWGDGYAQWAMTVISLGAAVISWWAVRLVRDSLALNRAAVAEANAANIQARELFVAENRPWLKIVGAKLVTHQFDGGSEQTFAWVKVRNVGITPALRVEAAARATASNLPLAFATDVERFAGESLIKKHSDITNVGIFPDEDTEILADAIDITDGTNVVMIGVRYGSNIDPDRTYYTAVAAIVLDEIQSLDRLRIQNSSLSMN